MIASWSMTIRRQETRREGGSCCAISASERSRSSTADFRNGSPRRGLSRAASRSCATSTSKPARTATRSSPSRRSLPKSRSAARRSRQAPVRRERGGSSPRRGGWTHPGSAQFAVRRAVPRGRDIQARRRDSAIVRRAGIDPAKPFIASCGSGVTANSLIFAAHLLGNDAARLYDGSWSEWGADPATPKALGPA